MYVKHEVSTMHPNILKMKNKLHALGIPGNVEG